MMEPCNCLTGSEENGWHEVRCAACIREEARIWAEAVARVTEIVQKLRGEPHG